MWENILIGFSNLLSVEHFLFINGGLALGIFIGAMPGLSAAMGIALFLPLTFGMTATSGMLLLCGIYCGAVFGGSITAILIKTPGTSAAAATAIDGYRLTQKGHPGKALNMALTASSFGGVFSALMLLFIAPVMAEFALKFGPAEFFSLAVFGLAMISGISAKSRSKGLIAGGMGLIISMIGLDPIESMPRLNFDSLYLMSGINIVPALIGLFAVAELLEKVRKNVVEDRERVKFENEKLTRDEVAGCVKTMVKSSLIGTILGAIPGTGATTAAFMGYNEGKRGSKHPEEFGEGSLEGIAAAETANNATTGSTLIPTLTLGIPGDGITAIMLGALTMQGLTPGPTLFQTQAEIMYTIIVGFLFINIFMYLQGKFFVRGFVNITRVPDNFLMAMVVVLCMVGGFALKNSTFEIYQVIVFGALGYVMKKFDIPTVPLLLGMILGPIAEKGMRQALILSKGSFSIFFTKPISCVCLVLAFAIIFYPCVKFIYSKVKGGHSK